MKLSRVLNFVMYQQTPPVEEVSTPRWRAILRRLVSDYGFNKKLIADQGKSE